MSERPANHPRQPQAAGTHSLDVDKAGGADHAKSIKGSKTARESMKSKAL